MSENITQQTMTSVTLLLLEKGIDFEVATVQERFHTRSSCYSILSPNKT